ncbi:MAG: hypothetical protein ABIO65_05155, partial [Nitrospiria bacterium]
METTDTLEFVTIEGLLAYGEALSRLDSPVEGVHRPPPPPVTADRLDRARESAGAVRAMVERVRGGTADAAAYRAEREAVLAGPCAGDPLVFFAAWNRVLADGGLVPLLHAPLGRTVKPTRRRPVAIVPRAQLGPQLVEDRIVLDLGDDRFWLLPRDLAGRTVLFALRHGVSRVESGAYRVGRRLANTLDPERGGAKANAVGAALAQMVGVVGRQLDFLHVPNYLDPTAFTHYVSSSPNTTELCRRVVTALGAGPVEPTVEDALESQDFGWATGLEKAREVEEAARAFGVEPKVAKRLLKHPLYSYPAGHSFF